MLLSRLKCVCLKQQAARYQDEPRPRVLHRSEHRGRVDSIHPRSPEQTSHKATPGSTSFAKNPQKSEYATPERTERAASTATDTSNSTSQTKQSTSDPSTTAPPRVEQSPSSSSTSRISEALVDSGYASTLPNSTACLDTDAPLAQSSEPLAKSKTHANTRPKLAKGVSHESSTEQAKVVTELPSATMANLDQTSKTAEPQGRKASGVDTSSNQDQHKTKLEEAVAAMSLNDGDEATTHPDVKAQSDLSNVAANSPTRNQKSAWLSDPKRLQSPDEDQSFSFEQGESIFPEDSVSRPSSPVLKASTRSAFPYLAHGPRPESRRCSSSPSHRNRGMSIGSDLSERSSTISTAFTGKSHSPSTLRVKRRRQQSSLGMGGAIGLHLGLDAEDDAVQRSEVGQFSNIQQAQRPVSSDSDVD